MKPKWTLLRIRARTQVGGRVIRGQVHQHADAPHALARLGTRRERPCHHRAAERG
jgi:hypothetical protein